MPIRVLILSAAYGAGHLQAARAIQGALIQIEPDCQVDIVEYFEEFVSIAWAQVTRASYLGSISYAPPLYGVFYEITGSVPPDSLFQRLLNLVGRDNLEKYLKKHHYDVILSVYPTPSGALSELRGQGKLPEPFATLVTDYTVHSQWIHPNCDLFMVAAPDVAMEIVQARDISPAKVVTVGMPVDEKFTRPIGREKAARAFGLDPRKFTILIVAGAAGATPGAKEQLEALLYLEGDWQAVFVCGRNKRLYSAAKEMVPARLSDRITVTGFTTKLNELMAASDVLVTKAGGLTVSEALVRGIPMIIYRPIPGQEEANTQYLANHDASLIANDRKSLTVALRTLLEDPVREAEMRRAACELGRPDAARLAASSLIALARSGRKSTRPAHIKAAAEPHAADKATARAKNAG
jgi:processive 1,2-diacylglycerol beta-glucosyltransferase